MYNVSNKRNVVLYEGTFVRRYFYFRILAIFYTVSMYFRRPYTYTLRMCTAVHVQCTRALTSPVRPMARSNTEDVSASKLRNHDVMFMWTTEGLNASLARRATPQVRKENSTSKLASFSYFFYAGERTIECETGAHLPFRLQRLV